MMKFDRYNSKDLCVLQNVNHKNWVNVEGVDREMTQQHLGKT